MKKTINQNNIKNQNSSVSRPTSNGMKKFFISVFIIISIFSFFNNIKKTEAAIPTMTIKLVEAIQGSNGKWDWRFDIDTTSVTNGTNISINTYKGSTKILSKNDKIQGNYLYYATGFELENNTNYNIIFLVSTNPNITKTYTGKTGVSGQNIPPTIVSFSPSELSTGNTVTIVGSNFTGTTNVLFGTTEANTESIIVDNDTKIRVEVPNITAGGKITVKTPKGTAISSQSFTVYTQPQEIQGQDDSSTKNSGVYELLAPIGEFQFAPKDIGGYFNLIFKIIIGLCAVLAVVMIVIGGIQYIGNESIFGKVEAKSKIIRSILGLLIALGSWALLNTINPDLLGGNVHVDQVSAEIDEDTEIDAWDKPASITGTTKTCTEGYINVATYGNGGPIQPKTINVCKSISANLKKLIDKAKSEKNMILSGYGSRTYEQQVQKRKDNHCKPDIYNSPSKNCNPETARPGHSKHESGKAIDFTCNGKTMKASGGKNSDCFKWLKDNAKTYGFYNLPSEPWHWSDDGH